MNAARVWRFCGANVVVSENAALGLTGHLHRQVVRRLRDGAGPPAVGSVGTFQKSWPL